MRAFLFPAVAGIISISDRPAPMRDNLAIRRCSRISSRLRRPDNQNGSKSHALSSGRKLRMHFTAVYPPLPLKWLAHPARQSCSDGPS